MKEERAMGMVRFVWENSEHPNPTVHTTRWYTEEEAKLVREGIKFKTREFKHLRGLAHTWAG